MTIAYFVPLMCAFAALVELVLFIQWRASGKISEGVFPIMAIATVATPFIVFALFKYVFVDVGSIRIF